jgi:hypothetical protein
VNIPNSAPKTGCLSAGRKCGGGDLNLRRIRSPGPLYEFPLERPLGVLSTPFRCHHDYFHPFLSRCRWNHSRSDALKMKAKACTRCRQSKLRCDSDAKSPDACTSCRSINKPCIVDRSFQCTSKKRRLLELESEVKRLREAAVMVGQVAINPPRSIEVVQALPLFRGSSGLDNPGPNQGKD